MTDIKFQVLDGKSKRLSDNDDGTYSEVISIIGCAASGLVPVTGTFTAPGVSASFTPHAGRKFNFATKGAYAGTVKIERSFDNGVTWYLFYSDQIGFLAPNSGTPISGTLDECEDGVQYRFNCEAITSGSVDYRLSQ